MPFSPTPLSRLRFRHQESRYQKRQTKQYAEQQRTIKALARPDQAIAPVTPSRNPQVSATKIFRLNTSITTLPPQPAISDAAVSSSKINPRFTLAQQYLLLWHILGNLPISQAHLHSNHALPPTRSLHNPHEQAKV